MKKKVSLDNFTLDELKLIKKEITTANSKEELLERVDYIISKKGYQMTESLNARFPVDWFNIDSCHIKLLHDNGIDTLAQLRGVEDISSLTGITEDGIEKISWAREYFNMDSVEQLPIEQRTDNDTVIKVIVKHSAEVGETYVKKGNH